MRPIQLLFGALLAVLAAALAAADEGRLEIRATDKTTGQPIAARMHLKNPKGQPVKPPKVPFWKDHFAFDGTIMLDLPLGTYTFEIESGPECKLHSGSFILERNSNDTTTIEMQ